MDNDLLNMGESSFSTGSATEMYKPKEEDPKKEVKKPEPVMKKKTKPTMPVIEEGIEEFTQAEEDIGRVICIHVETLWERRKARKEAKKLREMLKALPVQCRASYFKLLDLKGSTTYLADDLKTGL